MRAVAAAPWALECKGKGLKDRAVQHPGRLCRLKTQAKQKGWLHQRKTPLYPLTTDADAAAAKTTTLTASTGTVVADTERAFDTERACALLANNGAAARSALHAARPLHCTLLRLAPGRVVVGRWAQSIGRARA